MTANSLTYADHRRAAALIAHAAAGSTEGIAAILEEAGLLARSTHLLRALLTGYPLVAAELRTDAGLEALLELVEAAQARDDDIGRAARVAVAYRAVDLERFNAALVEANAAEAGPALLVAGVLELYSALLPELQASSGLAALRQWAARIAERENGTDRD